MKIEAGGMLKTPQHLKAKAGILELPTNPKEPNSMND